MRRDGWYAGARGRRAGPAGTGWRARSTVMVRRDQRQRSMERFVVMVLGHPVPDNSDLKGTSPGLRHRTGDPGPDARESCPGSRARGGSAEEQARPRRARSRGPRLFPERRPCCCCSVRYGLCHDELSDAPRRRPSRGSLLRGTLRTNDWLELRSCDVVGGTWSDVVELHQAALPRPLDPPKLIALEVELSRGDSARRPA